MNIIYMIISYFICFNLLASHRNYRPPQSHITRQDSYLPLYDIRILAIQKAYLEGLTISSRLLNQLITNACILAHIRDSFFVIGDITYYSRQTIFSYINTELEKFKPAPDLIIRGSLKNILVLPCSHYFHEQCIKGWLKDAAIGTCPLCRREFHNGQEKIMHLPATTDLCPICLDFYVEQAAQSTSHAQLSSTNHASKRPKGINYELNQRPPWRY